MKIAFFLALLVPICLGAELNCGGKPDLVFVLDSSTSVHKPDFTRQLAFVKSIIDNIEIGEDATQVAVVTYSDEAQIDFGLSDYYDKATMLSQIDNIRQRLGNTNTGAALDLVRTGVLTVDNGARAVGPKVVIVVTDGHSQVKLDTANAANQLRALGVVLVAIGVGNDVRQDELESIANDANHLFNVGDFEALATIRDDLVPAVCPTTTTEPPTTTLPDCSGNPDLVFVLDRSTSVDSNEFEQLRSFVLSFVEPITVGPNNTQISIVTYATDVRVEFYLNSHSTREAVENAIRNIQPGYGDTYTHLALQKVREEVLTVRHGARQYGAKVVIVVTDGVAQFIQLTTQRANELKNDNVKLFAVGIGSFDQRHLSIISDSIFTADGYSDISSIRDVLSSEACSVTRTWNPDESALL